MFTIGLKITIKGNVHMSLAENSPFSWKKRLEEMLVLNPEGALLHCLLEQWRFT